MMQTLMLFDIGSNRLRLRIERIGRDLGMDRLQFSAFLGDLNSDQRARLRARLENAVREQKDRENDPGKHALVIHVFPMDGNTFTQATVITRQGAEPCAPHQWPENLML